MKKKKSTGGRPSLPDHQIKKKRSLRLSDSQMDLIKEFGSSLQEFVDHHCLALERLNEQKKKVLSLRKEA